MIAHTHTGKKVLNKEGETRQNHQTQRQEEASTHTHVWVLASNLTNYRLTFGKENESIVA